MHIAMGIPFVAAFVIIDLEVASKDVKDHASSTDLIETRSAFVEALRRIGKSFASGPKLELKANQCTAVVVLELAAATGVKVTVSVGLLPQDSFRMRPIPFSEATTAVLVRSNGHCLMVIHPQMVYVGMMAAVGPGLDYFMKPFIYNKQFSFSKIKQLFINL